MTVLDLHFARLYAYFSNEGDAGRNVAAEIDSLNHIKTTADVLREFVSDIDAVGVKQTAHDWPDLVVTYNHAQIALECRPATRSVSGGSFDCPVAPIEDLES